jgi:hypothetical protein
MEMEVSEFSSVQVLLCLRPSPRRAGTQADGILRLQLHWF